MRPAGSAVVREHTHRWATSRSGGEPAEIPDRNLLRTAALALLVGVAYYVAARLSLRLALVQKNVTPLWPPTGIAVVAFLVLGRRVWPGVAIAAFAVNAPIGNHLWVAAATAGGNTLAPLLAATLLQRVGFRQELDRQRDAIAIVFLGALGSMLVSASIGTGALAVSGAVRWSDFGSAWTVWWTGDAMGVLVVAPFLLTVVAFMRRRPPPASWARRVEASALFVLITAVALWVTQSNLRLLFLVLPLVGYAAWRFQQRGAAPAALIAAGIATWAAAHSSGPFAQGSLFGRMLVLQAFNATVAFSSFFFAAVVTGRIRASQELERAAELLEEHVHERTAELSTANERLHLEVVERRQAERRLRQQERQLAEAQRLARIGSWEWRIPENRVTWSEEMYRIHGYRPDEFEVSFEKAVELVVPEDVARIRGNVESALRDRREGPRPPTEYRIVRRDGTERVLRGTARLHLGPDGGPLRMVGTVQDVTEGKLAEREHRISETLQRSLLPERLPEIPGIEIAARYVPATAGMEVGGDWYDVVQLPNGHVGVAIGDVAGHGLRAASAMGQIRMALRAFALEEGSPAVVVGRIRRLMTRLLPADMATVLYLVFDPEEGDIRFANAGHPPPLVADPAGAMSYLEEALSPPLGVELTTEPPEAAGRLAPGSTLLLFTDGLVERRGSSIVDGLGRLRDEVAASFHDNLEDLCDRVIEALVGDHVADDVALLALRPVPMDATLRMRVPAEPHVLAPLRHTVRRWLREVSAPAAAEHEILVACGEACANVIQHAYGAREGVLDVELALVDGAVEMTVRDTGGWRPPSGDEGGRGIPLMRGLMDSVDVDSGVGGTAVRMRRELAR
ncbi:MAG: SpoIIE family protein phosphatase [Actinomycetota bacterium]